METVNTPHNSHDADTDLMRILSACFVVMIHVAAGLQGKAALVWNCLARFSVPVFVILSGYYMLTRERSAVQIFRKCVRLLLQMLAWSAVYYVYNLSVGEFAYGGVKSLISYLLTQPIHLWYVYAAIALYLFTPVFFVFTQNSGRKTCLYALGIAFFLGSVVTTLLRTGSFPLLVQIVEKSKAPYTLGFVFLYLAGGYFRRFGLRPPERFVLYAAGIAGALTTVFGALALSARGANYDFLLSFFAPNVQAMGLAFFVFIKSACKGKEPRKASTFTAELARGSFGIYLLHPLILSLWKRYVAGFWPLAPAALLPLRTLAVFVLSAAVVFAIRKLPVLRWLVS